MLFAGGGSGGHISPGLAIAERLSELAPHARAIFVCSQRTIDATMLRDAGVSFVPIPATPLSVRPLAAMRFVRAFFRSKRMVQQVIEREGVSHVVLLGGFIAAPAASAARASRVPVMLVNLDVPPGKANRLMARRCDTVISAIDLPAMPQFAHRVTGMPIRRNTLAPADPATCRRELGLDPDRLTLLVTGASQGATSINQFMIELARAKPTIFEQWQVYHLAGQGQDEAVRKAYKDAGVRAAVAPFQHRMGLAWGAADLAISRAGASSVAEAAQNAVPTLFLPYPYHKDMHQKHNAAPLEKLGGAIIETDRIEPLENVKTVGSTLEDLMRDAAQRNAMRAKLRQHQFPDAAATIAQLLLQR